MKALFARIWICAPALVIWAIWWERNKRIFKNEFAEKEIVLQGIEKSISEVNNASLFRCKINPTISIWIVSSFKSENFFLFHGGVELATINIPR